MSSTLKFLIITPRAFLIFYQLCISLTSADKLDRQSFTKLYKDVIARCDSIEDCLPVCISLYFNYHR